VTAAEECAVLSIDARGLATLEIPDADGEVRSYRVSPAPEGLDEWACLVERLDGEGESPYRVARTPEGSWRCACPSFRYRKGPHGPRGCKHVASARPIFALVRSLSNRGAA